MKDGTGAGKQAVISRQELYEDYVGHYSQMWSAEPRPCGDARLGIKAARFLQGEAEPRETFTTFPFYQAVMEGREAAGLTRDWRKHLAAFIKATELLETFCVNLFLQPWKKEIKTLKTFTGPFVYHLLPVLTASTIQSVLASIGYLPHTDTQHRLSEDASPDKAMMVGFELLLARVECRHLLELLEDQPGPQWMEILQRRAGHHQAEEPAEERKEEGELSRSLADHGVKEEEKKEEERKEEEEEKKKEELGAKQWDQSSQVPLSLEARPAVKPQPKPRRCHILTEDTSILEMQTNYPDLAIRGRPLLQDKTQRASSSRNSISAHSVTTNNDATDSKAGSLANSDYSKSTKAATAAVGSKSDRSKAGDIFGGEGRSSSSSNSSSSSVCSDSKSISGTTTRGSSTHSSSSSSDGSRADDDLSGPQAISMHITLRAGTRPDQTPKPGEPQPTAEPPARTDRQAAAGLQNIALAKVEPPSLSCMEEEQELKELAERMGQLHVQEAREDRRRKEEEKTRCEESKNKEKRRKKEREPKEEEEQKQPILCHPSPLTDCNIPDCQSCAGGAGTERREAERRSEKDGERAERGGEDEHLAQSYVIVERHKK
uniref:uncharacterized protein n=1 Tax=Centroberyx gerrardi TaxID=166262 RepID=UPI003AAA6775